MFVNNFGDHVRDFTYIGDVVKYVEILAKKNIKKHDVYNICSNNPVNINKIVKDFKKKWKFKLNICLWMVQIFIKLMALI